MSIDNAAVMERLTTYCREFHLAVPRVEFEEGFITANDELLAFCHAEGISLDWLFLGVTQTAEELAFMRAMDALPADAIMRLGNAMRAHVKGGMPLKDALAMFGFRD